jgi:sugar phosphate isomerase/epimerase
MMKFAAQMNTLRAYCATQQELLDSLTKVADLGFDGVELEYGMLKVADRETLAAHLEALGLSVASIRSPFARTEFGLEDMIRQAKALNCENVGIGTMTTAQFNQGAAGYDRYFSQLAQISQRFREEGLRPVYSLRNHEFVRQNGQWIFDKLLAAPESSGIFFETDILPLTRAAVDPPRIFARLAGRMPICRLTDQKIRENEMYFFFPEREECPVGEGLFDLALWSSAARNAGAEWFVLGQNLCDREPLVCLELSLKNAKSLHQA